VESCDDLFSCGCVRLSVSFCHADFKKPEFLLEESLEPETEPDDGGGGGGDDDEELVT
jgi:hypothetical protein